MSLCDLYKMTHQRNFLKENKRPFLANPFLTNPVTSHIIGKVIVRCTFSKLFGGGFL